MPSETVDAGIKSTPRPLSMLLHAEEEDLEGNDEDRRYLPRMQEGKMGYLLLWLVGVPIPILLVIFLLRGCN